MATNLLLVDDPSVVAAVTTTTAINAASNAYSTIAAPRFVLSAAWNAQMIR